MAMLYGVTAFSVRDRWLMTGLRGRTGHYLDAVQWTMWWCHAYLPFSIAKMVYQPGAP
jgi:hypothetical protein